MKGGFRAEERGHPWFCLGCRLNVSCSQAVAPGPGLSCYA